MFKQSAWLLTGHIDKLDIFSATKKHQVARERKQL